MYKKKKKKKMLVLAQHTHIQTHTHPSSQLTPRVGFFLGPNRHRRISAVFVSYSKVLVTSPSYVLPLLQPLVT